ncbi:MAG TPA: exodeoxyribonuclease VII large subunit [Sphingobacteriaceae bacterium]
MAATSYISLKQLLYGLQNQLRQAFPATYWIKAELAGIRRSGSHVYFDFLELEKGAKIAQIRGTAFYGEGTALPHLKKRPGSHLPTVYGSVPGSVLTFTRYTDSAWCCTSWMRN